MKSKKIVGGLAAIAWIVVVGEIGMFSTADKAYNDYGFDLIRGDSATLVYHDPAKVGYHDYEVQVSADGQPSILMLLEDQQMGMPDSLSFRVRDLGMPEFDRSMPFVLRFTNEETTAILGPIDDLLTEDRGRLYECEVSADSLFTRPLVMQTRTTGVGQLQLFRSSQDVWVRFRAYTDRGMPRFPSHTIHIQH